EDEPHLRAVAMGDGDVPATPDHAGDVPARLAGGDVLVPDRLVEPVLDQRVPADRHHCPAPHFEDRPVCRVRNTMVNASSRYTTHCGTLSACARSIDSPPLT